MKICGCPIVGLLAVIATLFHNSEASLNSETKQVVLDLLNYIRAEARVGQLKWNTTLEQRAQILAENCTLTVLDKINFYPSTFPPNRIRSEFASSPETFRPNFLDKFKESSSLNEVWPSSTEVGCGHMQCPYYFGDEEEFYVCEYSFLGSDVQDFQFGGQQNRQSCTRNYDAGDDATSNVCLSNRPFCVEFTSDVLRINNQMQLKYCAQNRERPIVPDDPPPQVIERRVTSIAPRSGSIAGETLLRLTGVGFSRQRMNIVQLVAKSDMTIVLPCTPEYYHTTSFVIACHTRASPEVDEDLEFEFRVLTSIDGNYERVEVCDDCTFKYQLEVTPFVRNINPLASVPGRDLTLSGELYAVGYTDPDDADPNGPSDAFTRIGVGFSLCNHFVNETELPASIDTNGVTSSITCNPEDRAIASKNVTVILARRGVAFVPIGRVSVDNNFKPYHFQTHADILQVQPSEGSAAGGTTINILVRGSLQVNGSQEIQVYVGGVPCVDVSVNVNTKDEISTVVCTTLPEPPEANHYSCARGVLRDVFPGGGKLQDFFNTSQSNLWEYSERVYSDYQSSPPGFPRVSFIDRFRGFFVPPKTDDYTVSVFADGDCVLYFDNNSTLDLTLKPSSGKAFQRDQYTLVSSPIHLQAELQYYFELICNHNQFNWFVGMGVKVHSIPFTKYPYKGDHEVQSVNISATVVKEEHRILVGVLPQVQTLTIFLNINDFLELNHTSVSCGPFLIDFGGAQTNISMYPFNLSASKDAIEETLNDLEAVQSIGRIRVDFETYMFIGAIKVNFVFETVMDINPATIPSLTLDTETGTPSCYDDFTGLELEAEFLPISITQNFTDLGTFKLGFDNIYTPYFPADVSSMEVEESLLNLFTWNCTIAPGSGIIVSRESYDSIMPTDDATTTAFCGTNFKQNPDRVWSGGLPLHRGDYHISFAFQGMFRGLLITLEISRSEFDGPIEGVINVLSLSTNRWSYLYIDNIISFVHDDIIDRIGRGNDCGYFECYLATLTSITFINGSDLFIDEFFISNGRVTVKREGEPLRPNGLEIAYVSVKKEPLLERKAINLRRHFSQSNPQFHFSSNESQIDELPRFNSSNSNFGNVSSHFNFSSHITFDEVLGRTHYLMVVSEFVVTYTIRNCGKGLQLIQGIYENSPTLPAVENVPVHIVYTEKIQEASGPVLGTFNITIGSDVLSFIPSNVSARALECTMEHTFPDQQGFSVTRNGFCSGYSWAIEWEKLGGDQEELTVNGSELYAPPDVQISASTILDGGMWLSPIMGDMTRLPERQPQVEVIVKKIPSSCQSENCSFTFIHDMMPEIFSFTPSEGQNGTEVIINGTAFGDDQDKVTVIIGRAECVISTFSNFIIICTASDHVAGSYLLQVHVEGIGNAIRAEDVPCFTYLLSITNISPNTGGLGTGYQLSISGKGFLDFEPISPKVLNKTRYYLPFFRHSLGVPDIELEHLLNICPTTHTQFLRQLQFIVTCLSEKPELKFGSYDRGDELCTSCSGITPCVSLFYQFPAQVFVGGAPCFITRATIDHIECYLFAESRLNLVNNVTVNIFDQVATMVDAFSTSIEMSPTIESATEFGPVTGNTEVVITGSGFPQDRSEISVTIGLRECDIVRSNETFIECLTEPSPPSSLPIVVSTTNNGIAVMESALESQSLLPNYEYKLGVDITQFPPVSIVGGSILELTGGVFVEGETEVIIKKKRAEILNFTSDRLTIRVPSIVSTKTVNLIGDGIDYCWSEPVIRIRALDTVRWCWNLSGRIIVQSIARISPLRNASNSFPPIELTNVIDSIPTSCTSFTFREAGSYAIITQIDEGVELGSEVIVARIRASREKVGVYVAGFEAQYIRNSSSLSNRRRRNSDEMSLTENAFDTESCQETEVIGEDQVSIDVSPCETPVVSEVEPTIGSRLDTVFTLEGSSFSTNPSSNKVAFGGHACVAVTSSETMISCKFDTEASVVPMAHQPLHLTLEVTENSRGSAILPNEGIAVTLLPVIYSVTPSVGSVLGGTRVIITGDTFSFNENINRSLTLGFPCGIVGMNYTTIECVTGPSNSNETFNVSFHSSNQRIDTLCADNTTSCTFAFSADSTPVVSSVSPTLLTGFSDTVLTLNGSGFSAVPDENVVTVGPFRCIVTISTEQVIDCTVNPIPAATYPLSLIVLRYSDEGSTGQAQISSPEFRFIISEGVVISVSPIVGSTMGGTSVAISGRGFHDDFLLIEVLIGSVACAVRSVTFDSINCIIASGNHPEGTFPFQISSNGTNFTSNNTFSFEFTSTPHVTSVLPTSGQAGMELQVTGTGFGDSPSNTSVSVRVGSVICTIVPSSSNNQLLTCILGENFAGNHRIAVNVNPFGWANVGEDVSFRYTLVVSEIEPTEGSLAGMNIAVIRGAGFDPRSTTIEICDQLCRRTSTMVTFDEIECIVPSASTTGGSNIECPVTVTTSGQSEDVPGGYVYSVGMTPEVHSISRNRGGTAGGSSITIHGSGLAGDVTVLLGPVLFGASDCEVMSNNDTTINCVTGNSSRTRLVFVNVYVEGSGYALSNTTFWYVDLWSSNFTWGGGPLPIEGDFVVIERGQTVVLDTITPVLAFLLIRGELIFDRAADEIQLHSYYILITSGGRLEIGTENDPFLSVAHVVLYGHALTTELPVYGAKTLALREGTIDIHGKPINTTWTRLRMTANAGDTRLYLDEYVDWDAGGDIVIASTSFSQRENEEHRIASIEVDAKGSILNLISPLQYKHISVRQNIEGRIIDTSAEVGYLTRNVVVRGNVNQEFTEEVENCPEEFRPGQFDVQTCFRGRFGSENVTSPFGAQIFIHPEEKDKNLVTGRFSYAEITQSGQAFRLGRYSIHYHLAGNVSGSYVRGCSIHHTFNRAVTIHAVDYLLVEKNVAYNILGHAYFLEDGNEQFNIIQDNLGIFVRASSSLLNVDITPATFWVVNPNNIIRRNAAAGGTHFGFWYRIPKHPTGPSANASFCPRKQRVLEFADNTAHSFGWYGLWVFREYHPSPTGQCSDSRHAPVYFDRFLSYLNDKGVEFDKTGSLQLRNSTILDNKDIGVEVIELNSVWGENGPLISNTLIVGHSQISSEISSNDSICTKAGILTPKTYFLTVSGVTFVNFNRPNCFPIMACAQCREFGQGGFETRYRDIKFVDAGDQLTAWKWVNEHAHRDLDGTLTSNPGHPSVLLPTTNLLDPDLCRHHPQSSSSINGSICDGTVKFGRLSLFTPRPTSLRFIDLVVSRDTNVSSTLLFQERLLVRFGYMAIVQLNRPTAYQLSWPAGLSFTNISYRLLTCGLEVDDFLLLSYEYPRALDVVFIQGVSSPRNSSVLENPEAAMHGDYSIDDDVTLTYVVKGNGFCRLINYITYRCFYENCTAPTSSPRETLGRTVNGSLWSVNSTWPSGRLPREGEDVVIDRDVILDIDTPRLGRITITNQSSLLLKDGMDHVIKADLILIHNGRLVAGYPEDPFNSSVNIILYGDITSEELILHEEFSPIIGAKAIGVVGGELILNSRPVSTTTWTFLSQTSNAGSSSLHLAERVDWTAGQFIVITSTSYDGNQSEVMQILSVSSDRLTIELNGTLEHDHRVMDGSHFPRHGAEVGLLSRKIVIESGDPAGTDEEAFGCRVLVTSSLKLFGLAQLHGVEFKSCGQLGYTDSFDPRFSLAIFSAGDSGSDIGGSYVTSCSFHDGYNTAIGIFGTDGIDISENVIHGTVGPSIILTGSYHTIYKNLASLSQFLGTYRGRNEPFNGDWTANFEMTGASHSNITFNSAAGGARACFNVNGETCQNICGIAGTAIDSSIIRNNVAHSCLHGIHLGYSDGHSDCSMFTGYTIYSCFHYGFFSYSSAGIHITNSSFINNQVAVYISVIGESPRTHKFVEKCVIIENTTIVSAHETRCDDDMVVPAIANHPASHSRIRARGGGGRGHVGIIIPSFVSGSGHFPSAPWHSIISYPSIAGFTQIRGVVFSNFDSVDCSGEQFRDVVMLTNPSSEDANHPVHFEKLQFEGVAPINRNLLLHIHSPNLKRVNPSDCVDLDCDGLKEVVLKDLDGTFTGMDSPPYTIVSRAEIGWDDPSMRQRGLGDFRIPLQMLTTPSGSRIDVTAVYPNKGIFRGNSDNCGMSCPLDCETGCCFNEDWNTYICANIDHAMLVLESLDEDTEVRRLSPIGIGGSSYINILNGPMDHGWCGGYTCQERISLFYAIVATNESYTVGLTSTNPQQFVVRLLNANDNQRVVLAILYNKPQRQDVYMDGQLVIPNNANRTLNSSSDEVVEFEYKDPDPNEPDQFVPKPSDPEGSNFYDTTSKKLFINVVGSRTYRIVTRPVIVLSLTLTLTVIEFFDDKILVNNLALLLNIEVNRIRRVMVVREDGQRRKRQEGRSISLVFEIGDFASSSLNATEVDSNSSALTVSSLMQAADTISMAVQANHDILGLPQGVSISGVNLVLPDPVPKNNRPLATPETGGPQPGDNVTGPTYSETQALLEELIRNSSSDGGISLSIPAFLLIEFMIDEGVVVVEGIPVPEQVAPIVAMIDNQGMLSVTLGISQSWLLTAAILEGPDEAFLSHESAEFSNGEATFGDLVFSHPGSYRIIFFVTYPPTANFSIASTTIVNVAERGLRLRIVQQPQNGNTTIELYPYPSVELVDESGQRVVDHTWRNSTFLVRAAVEETGDTYTVHLARGVASFQGVHIYSAGTYKITFDLLELINSGVVMEIESASTESEDFDVASLPVTAFRVKYKESYSTIVGNDSASFDEAFKSTILDLHEDIEVVNVTSSDGSIVVLVYLTASNLPDLIDAVDAINTNPNSTFTFQFGGTILVPTSVEQDPDLLLEQPTTSDTESIDSLVIGLATALPLTAVLAGVTVIVVIIIAYAINKKNRQQFAALTVRVTPMERQDSDLLPAYESRPTTPATTPPPPYRIRLDSVGASSLSKTPVVFYTNPAYSADDDSAGKVLLLMYNATIASGT